MQGPATLNRFGMAGFMACAPSNATGRKRTASAKAHYTARPAGKQSAHCASIIGAGIQSGDLLAGDRSVEAREGSVVVAAANNEFTLKRYSNVYSLRAGIVKTSPREKS